MNPSYPAGASYEYNAPWNRSDQDEETCKACKGTGFIYEQEYENSTIENNACERCNN